MVVSLISAILDDYESYRNIWAGFVRQLRPPLQLQGQVRMATAEGAPLSHEAWKDSRLPLLQKVTALLLDRKRNKAGPQALRGMLPSVIELQVLLLPYPLSLGPVEAEAERRVFATELDNLIVSSLQGQMNVLQWAKVGTATGDITTLLGTDEERLQLAVHVGQLDALGSANSADDQLLSALNLVKIRTAMRLIQKGWIVTETSNKNESQGIEKERLTRSLKGMVQKWLEYGDESVGEELMGWRKEFSNIWSDLMKSK